MLMRIMGDSVKTKIQAVEEDLTTEMPVGEILRRTRLHYKQSIPDVERALHIRAAQIEAIESGDLSQLPGRVYAIGFIRSYSEYLGLDGEKMVEIFKSQATGQTALPELHFPAASRDTSVPSFNVVAVAIILVILAIAGWGALNMQDRKLVEDVPSVPAPEAAQKTPAPASGVLPQNVQVASAEIQGPPAPSTSQPDTAAAAAAEATKDGIILNIIENSWVEIKDQSGASILSRVLQAGDMYFVPDRPDLTISLGNAGGVRIEIDGKALQPIGKVGEVRRALPLDVEYLKKTFAVQPENAQEPTANIQNSVENPE